MLQKPPQFYGRNGKALVHCQRPKEALQREAGACSPWLLAKTQGKNPLSGLLERTALQQGQCSQVLVLPQYCAPWQ